MANDTSREISSVIRDAIAAFDEDFVMNLIDVYLVDAPKRLEDLRHAHASFNAEAFTTAAHTLKSSSAYVGAKRFSTLAKDLETASRAGGIANLGEQLTALEQEFVEVKAALEQVRNGR